MELPAVIDKGFLERVYRKLNRREYVHPDPLEFLYLYDDPRDREIAGMIASSLAYGRVAQILRSVSTILERIGPPSEFIEETSPKAMRTAFAGFKHRFTTGDDIANLLLSVRRVLHKFGTLESCFLDGISETDETIVPALRNFVAKLDFSPGGGGCFLVPCPSDGSACKRLNLFLRWMVRRDDVDPGGWYNISPAKLIVPLDTHMHRMCLAMGFTERKNADLRAAVEATEGFRKIEPDDPVRYDFALTRFGIWNADAGDTLDMGS